jgi:hypothetical protein
LNERYLSFGNSGSPNQSLNFLRNANGNLELDTINNAGANVTRLILSNKVMSGVGLLVIKRDNGKLYFRDAISGEKSSIYDFPSSPGTFNQIGLGCKLVDTASMFLNQPEYFTAFYNRATTDAEDMQNLRYVRRILAQRGVKL